MLAAIDLYALMHLIMIMAMACDWAIAINANNETICLTARVCVYVTHYIVSDYISSAIWMKKKMHICPFIYVSLTPFIPPICFPLGMELCSIQDTPKKTLQPSCVFVWIASSSSLKMLIDTFSFVNKSCRLAIGHRHHWTAVWDFPQHAFGHTN